MNYESSRGFSSESAVKFAESIAKKKSPKASVILDLILKKPARSYLNMCFAYLRWVDDFVDNPSAAVSVKKKFIERQKNLFTSIYREKSFLPETMEEACLYHFTAYALSQNKIILVDEVKNMVEALGMDADRLENSGIYNSSDLDKYINLMAKSLFNILYTFLYPEKPVPAVYLGKFTANAQMIRDLREDIDAGFVNISREEIDFYKLDMKNLTGGNFSEWFCSRTAAVKKILSEEVSLLKLLPFKFRVFTYYSLIYYLTWIIRPEVYDFKISYCSGRTLYREMKVYLISFLLSIKIFFSGIIFLPSVKG